MMKTAHISRCGTYRWLLSRAWGSGVLATFVMLNPSTADGEDDDPTIRKCIGFAKRWGVGELAVINLFAYRTSKPKSLIAAAMNGVDVIGPENSRVLDGVLSSSRFTVAAWGANVDHPVLRQQATFVEGLAWNAGCPLQALGITKDGHPRHPLFVPYDTELQDLEVLRARQ